MAQSSTKRVLMATDTTSQYQALVTKKFTSIGASRPTVPPTQTVLWLGPDMEPTNMGANDLRAVV